MTSSALPNLAQILAKNLIEARRASGLTREMLSARAGLSADKVGHIEAATGWPGLSALEALAGALGLSASRLLEPSTPAPPLEAEVEILTLSAEIGPETALRILRHRAAREPLPEVKSFVADLEAEIADLHREVRCLAAINRDLLLRLNQEKTSS